jgi:proteasome lid subunit RPN8/RPN11
VSTEHLYEVEARRSQGGGYVGEPMVKAARSRSTSAPTYGLRVAEDLAHDILAERPDVDSVGIYHTHPSPGPVRRYCGEVKR